MSHSSKNKKIYGRISSLLSDAGFYIADPDTVMNNFRFINKASLSQIIDEESRTLLKHDPRFFSRFDLEIPVNPDTHILNQYFDKHGSQGVSKVCGVGKVFFRELRTGLIDHPNKEDLANHVSILKSIFNGTYLDNDY